VLLLPGLGGAQAIDFAEGLRQELSALSFDREQGTFQITASLGVSELRTADQLESLIDRADAALYEAKRTGRDRVVQLNGIKGNLDFGAGDN
jgi:diguanylate cyclase (GGDEF)-like protein